jgi:hypothetical protein
MLSKEERSMLRPSTYLLAEHHKTRHLILYDKLGEQFQGDVDIKRYLGDADFFAAKGSEGDVCKKLLLLSKLTTHPSLTSDFVVRHCEWRIGLSYDEKSR